VKEAAYILALCLGRECGGLEDVQALLVPPDLRSTRRAFDLGSQWSAARSSFIKAERCERQLGTSQAAP